MQTISKVPARSAIIAVMLLLAAACSSHRATYAPDGRRGFVVTCSGLLNSWSNCLVNAGRACGKQGYDTLQGSEDDRSLLIACK